MKLRFTLLGFELARIDLDIPESDDREITAIDKGVKGMTGWWVSRMNK